MGTVGTVHGHGTHTWVRYSPYTHHCTQVATDLATFFENIPFETYYEPKEVYKKSNFRQYWQMKSRGGKSQRREDKKKEDQKRESLRRKKIPVRER